MAGAREIDVSGKIVAPGFIDVHTHDDRALFAAPDMAAKASQGVTTVITGNCGISLAPLTLDDAPAAAARPDRRAGRLPLSALRRLSRRARPDAGRDQRRLPCRAFDVAGRRDARVRPAGARGRDRSDGRAAAGGARRRRDRDVHQGCSTRRRFTRLPPRSRRWRSCCGRPARSTRRICATRPSMCSTVSTRAFMSARAAGVPVVISHHKVTGRREFRPHRRDPAEDRGGDAAAGDRARRLSVYCLLDGAAHGADRGRAEGHDHLVEAAPGTGRARPRRYRARLGRERTRRGGAAAAGRARSIG